MSIPDMVSALIDNNTIEAESAFKEVIGKKVGDAKEYHKKVKEQKTTVKSVNYSILYMKAVKALQEAMTRIETLESKVKTLEDA